MGDETMAVKESHSSPMGTHPSMASSCTIVVCDHCGEEFRADCCIDDGWQLHGEVVGYHDSASGEPVRDYCTDCYDTLFGAIW
jgi:hypothetical protein